jgi:hypothetical protein
LGVDRAWAFIGEKIADCMLGKRQVIAQSIRQELAGFLPKR